MAIRILMALSLSGGGSALVLSGESQEHAER